MNVPVASRTSFGMSVVALMLASSSLCLAQPGQTSNASTTRLLVRVTQVKPEMVNEWISIQKNEVNAAIKKADVSTRTVLVNELGNPYEYVSITPLESFATLDRGNILIRSLGQEAGARLQSKLSRCIDTQRVYVATRVNDLSVMPDPSAPPLVWVSVRYRVGPGKGQDYENFLKTDLLPVYKKAKADGKIAGFSFSRRGLGADPLDRTQVVYLKKFADLEAGSPITQILGQEAATKLQAKGTQMATVIEQVVRRRVADLSF